MKSYLMRLYLTHRRLKVPRSPTKTEVKVKVNIKPGPSTDYQRALWRKWWRRLTGECQHELKAENEAKREQ